MLFLGALLQHYCQLILIADLHFMDIKRDYFVFLAVDLNTKHFIYLRIPKQTEVEFELTY